MQCVTLYCEKCKKFNVYEVKDDMTKEDINHIKCKFCDNKEQSLIDQDIASVITLLNIKGYETAFSCAGHVEKVSKSGKKYYSLPYISFKSLFTMPTTVPARWTFESIPLKCSAYNLHKNMDICALQDINSRSIIPAHSSNTYITELQWKHYIEELEKWVKDLPECYTDKEDKTLYYKLKSINKNIDAVIIQSKIYNELTDYIDQIYEDTVKQKEYDGDIAIGDAYTVSIAADINDSRSSVESIITINAYLKVESAIEIQLEVKNLVNLSSDVLSLKFVTRGSEEDPDYIVYDTSILTNAYLATEFIMYNRMKDYNKFEYILEDKEYIAPVKITTIDISKVQNNAATPIAVPKSSVRSISIPTADSTNFLLADAIMKLIDAKLDKKIEDKISSMCDNNSSKNDPFLF